MQDQEPTVEQLKNQINYLNALLEETAKSLSQHFLEIASLKVQNRALQDLQEKKQ